VTIREPGLEIRNGITDLGLARIGSGAPDAPLELLVAFADAEVMQRLAPGTAARHAACLLRFARSVEDPLLEVTTDDLREWMDARSLRWSASTLSQYRASIHAFYNWATNEGLIARDPSGPLVWHKRPIEVGDWPGLCHDYRASMERRGLKANTVALRLQVLRRLYDHVAPRSLLDVASADIEDYLDANKTSPKYRYTQLSHFHNFFAWTLRQGLVDVDPTVEVERPRRFKGVPRPITDADLAAALERADPETGAMLALAAYQGMRCAEIAGLHFEDILGHLDPPVLIVRDGKGSKQRILPLHPEAWAAVTRYRTERRTGPVFTQWRDRPAQAVYVSQHGNKYLHDSGTDATMHQMRHWFASTLYQSTRDIRMVQEMLGHASPDTTAVYAAFSPGAATDAVRALKVKAARP